MLTEAQRQMDRALNAIYLEMPASICDDVRAKVHARIAELEAEIERLKKT